MVRQQLLEDLKKTIEELGFKDIDPLLSIPKNPDFGDYTTNIALQLAKLESPDGKQSVEVIAKKISQKIKRKDYLEKVEIAGGGFINFFIKPANLMQSLHNVCNYSSLVNPEVEVSDGQKRKVMVEFTDPNPFKEFHIGHVLTNAIGESLCRLFEATGAEVKRADYFGDVGLHVAKSVWGMQEKLKDESLSLEELEKKSLADRIHFLGQSYARGALAYDKDEVVREQIRQINYLIYVAAQEYMQKTYSWQPQIDYQKYIKINKKQLKEVGKLFEKGREWSLAYFETIYTKLGTKFDYYYPESIVGEFGLQLVRDHIDDGVFEKSEGAIIFPGDKFGLHRRVFINSLGLPTYEAKELGLAIRKYEDFQYDLSVVITGNEIQEYFKVLMMALSQIHPELAKKTHHLGHGMLRMVGGKMSSRTGKVITFDWLFGEVRGRVAAIMKQSPASKEIKDEEKEQIIDVVSIGAIKFAMLKFSPTTNITFDLERSVSLDGDSGPYVQYSFARAKSVLRSAQYDYQPTEIKGFLEKEERELLRRIEHFDCVVEEAAANFTPNALASYLLDFAKVFNLFYQKHPIINPSTSLGREGVKSLRLALTCAVAVVLKQGLNLLGIESPERM